MGIINKQRVCYIILILSVFASVVSSYKLKHNHKSVADVCFEMLLCFDGDI